MYLNDIFAYGSNLLELIPKELLKFQEKRIRFISDIRKEFLQISVNEQDRDCVRFVWWLKDIEGKIGVFRYRGVVFGVNCSSFLLEAFTNRNLKRYQEPLQIVADRVRTFFVDNCVTSLDSEEDLWEFVRDATYIMAGAKSELWG
jgi:hypothetical protein